METIARFIVQNWKPLGVAGLVIAAFLGGLAVGSRNTPDKVTTTEVAKTKETAKLEEKTAVVDKTKTDVKVNKKVVKTKVTTKDGTITEREESETQAVKTVFVDRVIDRIVKQDVIVEKLVDKTVIVDNRKNWRVGVLGGVHPEFMPVPRVESWAIGADVERRVAGPFWVGVWGMGTTSGMAMGGIKVALEF